MLRILRSAAFVALCAATTCPGHCPPRPDPSKSTTIFGASQPPWSCVTNVELGMVLDAGHADGFTHVRLYLPWGRIEKSKGNRDWGRYGNAIELAKSEGLDVHVTLSGPIPRWAAVRDFPTKAGCIAGCTTRHQQCAASCTPPNPGACLAGCKRAEDRCNESCLSSRFCAPSHASSECGDGPVGQGIANGADFAAFAAAAATEFATSVSSWALWQEPNDVCQWGSNPNLSTDERIEEYQSRMLVPGFDAIRGVIPTAIVTAPGTTAGIGPESIRPDGTAECDWTDDWVVGLKTADAQHPHGVLVRPLGAITTHLYGTAEQINGVMKCTLEDHRGVSRLCTTDGKCTEDWWLEEFGLGSTPECGADPGKSAGDSVVEVLKGTKGGFKRAYYWNLQGAPGGCDYHLYDNLLAPLPSKQCAVRRFLRTRNGGILPPNDPCSTP